MPYEYVSPCPRVAVSQFCGVAALTAAPDCCQLNKFHYSRPASQTKQTPSQVSSFLVHSPRTALCMFAKFIGSPKKKKNNSNKLTGNSSDIWYGQWGRLIDSNRFHWKFPRVNLPGKWTERELDTGIPCSQ